MTYYNLPGIKAEIDSLTTTSHEHNVRCIWNAILTQQFPPALGYMTKPEAPNPFGVADLTTYRWVNGRRRVFFIVQCKRVSYETSDQAWQGAANQLRDYLAAMVGTRPLAARSPVFGAVVVGRWVKFYEYLESSQQIKFWKPTTSTKKHIANHDGYIQRALDEILNSQ